MRSHLDFFIPPFNHLTLALSDWVLQIMLCSLSHQVLCFLLSSSLFSVFPSLSYFSCLPRHGSIGQSSLSAALSSKRQTLPLVRETYHHLEPLWKTGWFLGRSHTILQEPCHLTKGHKAQSTKKTQLPSTTTKIQNKKTRQKKNPTTSKLFALPSQNWPAGPNSERLRKLRLRSGSTETCLQVDLQTFLQAICKMNPIDDTSLFPANSVWGRVRERCFTIHRRVHSYSSRKAQGKVWIFIHYHTTASTATWIQRLGETHLLVGHCVIPPEKSCSDVVSHHHVHSVVVMSKEDAEHPYHTECPAKPVIPPESPWGICEEAQAVIISKRNVTSMQVYCSH